MNAAYLHLILNHIPSIGVLIGLGLAAVALVARKPDLLKAAFGLFVIAAVFAAATYLTGESAEEVVEGAGISEARIEAHEESAAAAAIGAGVLGVLALGGLVLAWGKPVRPALSVIVLTGAVVVAGLITYTAKLGGEIRHPEITGAAFQPGSARVGGGLGEGYEFDDD